MITQKFHEPFSPAILETAVPEKFVDIVNGEFVDGSFFTKSKGRKKWDSSDKFNLVDFVLTASGNGNRAFLFKTIKQGCLDYLNYMIEHKRNNPWTQMDGAGNVLTGMGNGTEPSLDNIYITQSWVVSQYAGDFTPLHHHAPHIDNFSGVIYLKVPPGMNDEWEEKGYPANGLIEYAFGESQWFRSDNLKFKPEVGKFLIFPSWLKHLVYPFSVEGERRVLSFNAKMITK